MLMGAAASACGVVVEVVMTVDALRRTLALFIVKAVVGGKLVSPVTFLEAAKREQTQ